MAELVLATTIPGVTGLLAQAPLFQGLGEEDVAQLAAVSTVQDFPANAEIITEGDEGTTFYCIVSGAVKVIRAESGALLAALGPGESFGEMALLDGGLRSASVVAVTEVRCLVLPQWEFTVALKHTLELALALLRVLSRRLRASNQALSD